MNNSNLLIGNIYIGNSLFSVSDSELLNIFEILNEVGNQSNTIDPELEIDTKEISTNNAILDEFDIFIRMLIFRIKIFFLMSMKDIYLKELIRLDEKIENQNKQLKKNKRILKNLKLAAENEEKAITGADEGDAWI